ncbi:MAG TPA: helix-turn-helix domain-containing protein [Ktedonobacterales bacterium]|jgi:DNA-binding HxlR family transcriptional regulator
MSNQEILQELTASTHDEKPLTGFCPRYHHAVELIGRRWSGAILRVLISGPRRFHELLSSIPGLSDRLLSERLRELEAEKIVIRRVLPGPPVKVQYELTEAGHDLEVAVRAIASWAEKWLPASAAQAHEEPGCDAVACHEEGA